MFPITEAWSFLSALWDWMGRTYILNVAEISITFKQLLIYTTFFSIIAWTIHAIFDVFIGEGI